MSDLVYVIDASSLFNTKRQIKADRQWDFFVETMTEMVESGELLIIPQVEGESEQADPFVVARALELSNEVNAVCVVTDDTVNRLPLKVSMSEVCDDYGITWITLGDFLGPDHLDLPRNWLTPEGRKESPI